MKFRIAGNEILVGGLGHPLNKRQRELQDIRLKKIENRRKKTDELLKKKYLKN